MNLDDTSRFMLCLAAWREARGEPDPRLSMRAVMHTIVNAATSHARIYDLVTKQWYISSLTDPKDRQLNKWPQSTDPLWLYCLDIVEKVIGGTDEDPTGGATNYFNPKQARPAWALKMVKTKTINNHDFYRA